MTDNPQLTGAGADASEEASPADLEQQLKMARAEIAILEHQLREYSEKLEHKVDERTRELEFINRIASTVSRSLNLDVILRESLAKVLELLELDVGGIFLHNEEQGELRLMTHLGFPAGMVEKMAVVPVGEGCPGTVISRGEPVLVQNIAEDEIDGKLLEQHKEFVSLIGIPLESKGRVRGAMCILSSEEGRFTSEEVKLLAAIGSEIGVAIENASLYEKSYIHSKKMEELSITDSLTGLYNRRHFYRRIKEEVARANRQEHPLSLLVVDLDNLKQYIDKLGHLKGDEALKGVSEAITACIRQNVDSGYRYGGDEFAVILPYSDEERASQIAERIRKTYEDFSFPNTGLSIGLTQLKLQESIDDLVNRADTAMYFAKHSGGNKVHIAQKGNQTGD